MRANLRLGRVVAAAVAAAALVSLAAGSIAAEVTEAAHRGPAIWRVRAGGSTVYLLGSLHILPDGYSWMSPQIETAMANSDQFIFEVPVGESSLAEERDFIVHNGLLPRRQSIRTMLSPGEFDVYASVMRSAGLTRGDYERYRPWLAALVLGLAYLHPDNLVSLKGADDDVMDYARANGRQLEYLETPLQQLQLLTAGTEESQLSGLKNLIQTLPSSRNLERDLRDAWIRGDADGLNALLQTIFRRSPEAADFLVGRRNRLWIPVINTALVRSGATMVTVGAAHLGGRSGLIALICAEGYKVDRLSDSGDGSDACGSAPGPAQ